MLKHFSSFEQERPTDMESLQELESKSLKSAITHLNTDYHHHNLHSNVRGNFNTFLFHVTGFAKHDPFLVGLKFKASACPKNLKKHVGFIKLEVFLS